MPNRQMPPMFEESMTKWLSVIQASWTIDRASSRSLSPHNKHYGEELYALCILPSHGTHDVFAASSASVPFSCDNDYLKFLEAVFVVRSWGFCVQAMTSGPAAANTIRSLQLTSNEVASIVAALVDDAEAHMHARLALSPLPRVIRLCGKLGLNAKATLAVQYILLLHAGCHLPSVAVGSLSPSGVARMTNMSPMELFDFLRESNPLAAQGIVAFVDSRMKLPNASGEGRFKMTQEVVTALTGLQLGEEDLIKIEGTALAGILSEDHGPPHTPLASGSSFPTLGDKRAREAAPASSSDTDASDDASQPVVASDELVLPRQRISQLPYADDVAYMDDAFKLLTTLVKMRTAESDMKDEEDVYYNPKNKSEAQLRENLGKERVLRARMASRLAATHSAVKDPPTDDGPWQPRAEAVSAKLELCEFEKRVLWLLVGNVVSHDLIIAINGRYVMRGDGQREITVGYILFVLCDNLHQRIACRRYFGQSSALVRHGLVSVGISSLTGRSSYNTDLMDFCVDIDRKLVDYLMGLDTETAELVPGSRLYRPTVPLTNVVLPDDTQRQVLDAIKRFDLFVKCKQRCGFGEGMGAATGDGLTLLFYGPSGTGKTMLANAVACHLNKKVLLVNVQQLAADRGPELLKYLFREAKLNNAIIFFDECEQIFEKRETGGGMVASILAEFERFDGITILATNRAQVFDEAMNRRISVMVPFRLPDHQLRLRIWRNHVPRNLRVSSLVDFNAVAMEYELTGGLIRNAMTAAISAAVGRELCDNPELTQLDLVAGARSQLRGFFQAAGGGGTTASQYLTPQRNLRDLVVESRLAASLATIVSLIKARGTLFSQWGFNEDNQPDTQFVILMSGPAGTGKSLAAEGLALECGFNLRVVNCAELYLKEKDSDLAKVFDEARTLNAAVVFDCAEWLYQDSTSEKAQHLSQLIQYQASRYNRPVLLLATDNADASSSPIDPSLLRLRVSHHLTFRLPDRALRQKLWERSLPDVVPKEGSIDFALLSSTAASASTIQKACFACCAAAVMRRAAVTTEDLRRSLVGILEERSARRTGTGFL